MFNIFCRVLFPCTWQTKQRNLKEGIRPLPAPCWAPARRRRHTAPPRPCRCYKGCRRATAFGKKGRWREMLETERQREMQRERTKGQRWGRRGGALPDLAPPPPLPGAQSSSLDSPWRRLSLATLGKRRDTTSAGGEEGCCVQRRRGGRPLACRRRSPNEGRCVRQRRGGRPLAHHRCSSDEGRHDCRI